MFLNKLFFISLVTLLLGLVGCAQQTQTLQNQYGPRSTATKAEESPFDDYWFSTRISHPNYAQATNNNLGAQIVDQKDLTEPRKVGNPNPMAAVGAVERYQKGEVRALSETEIEAGGGGSGSGGGGSK
ncbi:MAG: hypothetical protein LBT38_06780 [Deltaproteobacteria bacterium]|nr:hypothetical protein [Deltaproteobacteria bacterium]